MKSFVFVFTAMLFVAGCSTSEKKVTVKKLEAPPIRYSCDGIHEPKKFSKTFTALDLDKSSDLSRDEYLCQVTASFASAAQSFDANRDGKVSIIEFLKAKEAAFDAADKDKSSSLTPKEFKSASGAL